MGSVSTKSVSPGSEAQHWRPENAAGFVAEAERISNAHDWAATRALYAPDAVLVTINDGAEQVYRGADEITEAWKLMFGVTRRTGLQIEKRLESADDTTIVNSWQSRPGSRGKAYGVEIWRFGPNGLVVDQTALGFLSVSPLTNPMQGLRVFLTSPRAAIAFALARLRD